jgi:hypothetical protein
MVTGTVGLLAAGVLSKGLLVSNAFASPPLTSNVTLPADFLSLSTQITGYEKPDLQLAQRLYTWLQNKQPQLQQNVANLSALLANNPGVESLQAQLATQPPEIAELYQSLLSGWYLGVVGKPTELSCIGFENIVSYRVMNDNFTPVSYCPGEPNFWTHPPRKENPANA